MTWPENINGWMGSWRLLFPAMSLSTCCSSCSWSRNQRFRARSPLFPLLYLSDDSWIELRGPRVCEVRNSNNVPLWDDLSGVLGKALTEIREIVSRSVTPRRFLKDLSESLFTFGADQGRREVTEGIFGFWSENVPVGFPEVGVAGWSLFRRFCKPAIQVKQNRKTVWVKDCRGHPVGIETEMGVSDGDIWWGCWPTGSYSCGTYYHQVVLPSASTMFAPRIATAPSSVDEYHRVSCALKSLIKTHLQSSEQKTS